MNIDKLLLNFLDEDIGRVDITSNILPDKIIDANIICKEDAIIAGVEECIRLFNLVGCSANALVDDGTYVKKGTSVIDINGNAKKILSAERTALNIMMRMSGIATLTRRYIDIVRNINNKVMIAGTRKTAPGLRYFDKKAIEVAGGYTHRYRLDEMVLIKDNHLAILGSVKEAVRLARKYYDNKYKIEVEVESLEDARDAINAGADIIMLDNLDADEVNSIISILKDEGLRDKVLIEVSGGINLDNIKEYARSDVDIISIGSITHSVKAIDLSLEISL
jgi:nicotinate-nucleotide pyrophosphorylase (carboxylating)